MCIFISLHAVSILIFVLYWLIIVCMFSFSSYCNSLNFKSNPVNFCTYLCESEVITILTSFIYTPKVDSNSIQYLAWIIQFINLIIIIMIIYIGLRTTSGIAL